MKKWEEKLGKNWRDNFICILDECYESKAESLSREGELVNDDTRDELCINVKNGGSGWDYGNKFPEEVREKMRENHANIFGENNPNFGKPLSEEHKQKISIANSGKTRSKETREKISIVNSGENNPNFGKPRSKETKQKISESKRNKQFDHLIKMLNDDENKSPCFRKHRCLICNKILSHKSKIKRHLKLKHFNEYETALK